MFDFSFAELGVIGAVALVVLGPERLPKVARTVGDWVGKAQRYVAQVKSDINREMELAELKKLQEEARDAAQSVKSSVENAMSSVESEVRSSVESGSSTSSSTSGPGDYSWEGAGDNWQRSTFPRRYKPGMSVDELAEEVIRLKRQLAMPDSGPGTRRKYAPRARVNRPRIRR